MWNSHERIGGKIAIVCLVALVGARSLVADAESDSADVAKKELRLLKSEKRVVILSLSDTKLRPASAVYQASSKAIYFTEQTPFEDCPARDIWKVELPKAKGERRKAPEKIARLSCVWQLRSEGDQITVTFSLNDGLVRTVALSPKQTEWKDPIARTSPDFAAWRWKKDLLSNLEDEPLFLDRLHLHAAKLLAGKKLILSAARKGARSGDGLALVHIGLDKKDDETPPLAWTLELPKDFNHSEDPHDLFSFMGTGEEIYGLFNGANDSDRLARIVVWNTSKTKPGTLAPSYVLGHDTPYRFRTAWTEQSAKDWSARRVWWVTNTENGIVFSDSTVKLNEWPIVAYFSPRLKDTSTAFIRLPAIDGKGLSGLSYYSGGIIATYGARQLVIWHGEASPFGEGVGTTTSGEETERSREEFQRNKGEKP